MRNRRRGPSASSVVVSLACAASACVGGALYASPVEQQSKKIAASAGGGQVDDSFELCGTQQAWDAAHPDDIGGGVAGSCPLQGDCDDPSVRNSYIPSGSTPIKTIRIRIHIFAETNGSNPASSLAETQLQINSLNSQFAPYRIQFVHTAHVINDSAFRNFSPGVEDSAMKNTYAESPATQLNVYVVNTTCCYAGLGTFPWDANALTNAGGIIIDDDSWDATNEVLAHEVGHCIGLWHTHHGVSEVGTCSDCYENPVGNDTTGDFCSDTPATPVEGFGDCDGTGGSDPCTGSAWGAQAQNYMGYAGPPCWSQFTSQQAGRMHCWISAKLQSWLESPPQPCPAPGSCTVAHANAGCENQVCCEAVCDADPFCCESQWDQICADEGTDICLGCGGVSTGSCYATHGPYCDDQSCCDAVCGADAFCCANQWDGICVDEATEMCNSCGGSVTGSCYSAHANAHCNDAGCCTTVCASDPFCCNNQWDSICVNEALDTCPVQVMAGPITYPANGNQYYLLSLATVANAQAKAASIGGHLAVISSAAENEWIRANIANFGGVPREVWIGASDFNTEGTFHWWTLEPFSYTNWAPGEPNNSFDEDFVEMYPTVGTWNDVNQYGSQNNYAVVEVEVLVCGDEAAGSCFAAHSGPFCSDAACCAEVCGLDPFCCNTTWDGLCAQEAFTNCYNCGPTGGGTCFTVHGPGCTDAACCAEVCLVDSFCCLTQWDSICVNEATAMCAPCVGDLNSSGVVDAADLSILLGAWGTNGLGNLNGDSTVDAADLSILLGAWGPCD
jgi:hypothetical protein